MSDSLRYRLIDEPRASALQRFALPPLLVFIVATYFLPWGLLLLAANALALNGPHRDREIAFALLPIGIYFGALALLDEAVRTGLLPLHPAQYVFVAAVGIALLFVAIVYVSQHETAELRRYLQHLG